MYASLANPYFSPMPGLGATAAQEGTAIGGAVGTSTVAILTATGAIAGPVGAAIGAGIGLVTSLVSSLIANSGCGVTCVQTSQWANQAGAALDQNIQAYFAQPAPRSRSSQQAALANFDAIWARLQELCGQAGTGDAGVRCISDRQAGACHWKQTPTSSLLQYPGEPQPGACWNWFSGQRDPIANDPNVVDDSASALAQGAADTTASVVSGSSSSLMIPLLIVAGVLVALVVMR